MKYSVREEKGFVSLIGMVIAVCIVCYLMFVAFKTYFKNPVLEETAQQTDSGRSIDASNYQSIVESSRVTVEEYNKQVLQRQKQIDKFDE